MPDVKNLAGEIVAELPYNQAGEEAAEEMVSKNPSLSIDYNPGGEFNAMERMETNYAGSGKTGYNAIGGMPKMPNSPKKDMY